MKLVSLAVVILLAFRVAAAESGSLLVDTYGTLLLVSPEGRQRTVAERVDTGALSPDGRNVAFTTVDQVLFTVPVAGGAPKEIARLPAGAHLEEIGWKPDGAALAWVAAVPGKSADLFLAPFPPAGGPARNLGHWYQGFSFSPDGSKIVHAVNTAPNATGLEVLDVATGARKFVHRAKNVVWDARYSPDGQFIAYRMTTDEPSRGSDDEPDCTPPTLGLFVYSIASRSAAPVRIRAAPKDWSDVKSYEWSPDSKRIVLTLGTTDCDYPGSANGVFVTSLDLKWQARVSQSGMAFEPAFSPDGSEIAYVDFSESPAKLFRYTLRDGAHTLIRRATEESNYFRLLGWR